MALLTMAILTILKQACTHSGYTHYGHTYVVDTFYEYGAWSERGAEVGAARTGASVRAYIYVLRAHVEVRRAWATVVR